MVFVFGSNEAGRHGAGAARVALKSHGAIYGQGEGPQGAVGRGRVQRHQWSSFPGERGSEVERGERNIPEADACPGSPTASSRRQRRRICCRRPCARNRPAA